MRNIIFKGTAKRRPTVHRNYLVERWVKDPDTNKWYQEEFITPIVSEFWQISPTTFFVLTEGTLMFIIDVQES